MLPIHRWPELLYRTVWALLAPQRAALDYSRRIERQWSINRDLNSEVQALRRGLEHSFERINEVELDRARFAADMAREASDRIAAETSLESAERIVRDTERARAELSEQLSAERDRHKETALNLERETAKGLVLADQMLVLVQWIETYKAMKEAEARIENLRGRKQGEE
jgi:hypothetical protein